MKCVTAPAAHHPCRSEELPPVAMRGYRRAAKALSRKQSSCAPWRTASGLTASRRSPIISGKGPSSAVMRVKETLGEIVRPLQCEPLDDFEARAMKAVSISLFVLIVLVILCGWWLWQCLDRPEQHSFLIGAWSAAFGTFIFGLLVALSVFHVQENQQNSAEESQAVATKKAYIPRSRDNLAILGWHAAEIAGDRMAQVCSASGNFSTQESERRAGELAGMPRSICYV